MTLFFENKFISFLFLFCFFDVYAQPIANYVNNPSFEELLPSYTLTSWDAAKFWKPINSINNNSYIIRSNLLGTVPVGFGGYQQPKSGANFVVSSFYCDNSICADHSRLYPLNILKAKLKPNTSYCAKYHVVNTNNNVIGIQNYEMYFGDNLLDTINHCSIPLTYLIPQIEYQGTIVTDTLHWVPVTGTFVASGIEKYMVLGNFKSNSLTSTAVINPTYLPNLSNDILIDDVSLIEMDLPAFAGRDTIVFPGSSVFLGREPDVGIDEACIWYKLPDMINPIDTIAGFWINPTATATYVVKQQLWCNNTPKWDTVVVETSIYVGNSLFDYPSAGSGQAAQSDIKVFPNPADGFLEIKIQNQELNKNAFKIIIKNNLGQTIREEELIFKENKIEIKTNDLPEGVYFLQLKSNNLGTVRNRFIISR